MVPFIHSFCSPHYERSINYKRVLHRERSSASSCFLYIIRSCLRLLPCLPVTSTLYFIFPLVTCFRKAVPTQDITNPVTLLSFYCMYDIPRPIDSIQRFFISHTISPADLLHPFPAPHFKSFRIFMIYFRNILH